MVQKLRHFSRVSVSIMLLIHFIKEKLISFGMNPKIMIIKNSYYWLLLGFLFVLPAIKSIGQESPAHTLEIVSFWTERFDGFYRNAEFPLDSSDAQHLSYFEPNFDYRVDAEVELLWGEQPFQMPTYAGTTSEYVRYGIARFQIGEGPVQELTLYRSTRLFSNPTYKDHLFVPFLDLSNGELTYEGGRYLDLSIKEMDAQGRIIIDFNKAYNPLCAYSGGYRCPIPPLENHLSIRILAGELQYTGSLKERPESLNNL